MTLAYDRLTEMLDYDQHTGLFSWKKSPTGSVPVGAEAGAKQKGKNGRVYLRVKLDGTFYFLHNLAWFYVHKVWPDDLIDHISGDSNAILNLRPATYTQNAANKAVARGKKHGFKGVSTSRYQFAARICVEGVNKYLGYFSSPREAALAYDQAAEELFGEFALTNKKLGLL